MNGLDKLSLALSKLPDELLEVYKETTKEVMKETGEKLENFFRQNSGSNTLNKYMYDFWSEYGDLYVYDIDWSDDLIVNELKGKSYGRDADKPRERGKRNYSIAPATSHDLAYIIDFGHTVTGKEGKTYFLQGNRFIQRGMQRVKNWRKERDSLFKVRTNDIAKEFE